jgi:CBS domain-containing protein
MSPTGTISVPLGHRFESPDFEKATVLDAMRLGVISCTPDASLREVARAMATYRIHSVVITAAEGDQPWAIVTDVDLTAASGKDLDQLTARDIWHTRLVTIEPDEPLSHAVRLMTERGVTHLVVVQPKSGRPVGVLSTLDVVGVLAW